ncbi:helix-turn-helix domain-containing protein [Listeria booriae]|uniref:helix-turn-helix domain-containing protein n=1 Tax=Listeria booriae TaxID=1552123 RepID=UPI00164DA22C|nr:helix-turn-helix domain-containing protein [Listeria booriae]MBC6165744.1 helix-turn-helix domain-containing protein [Listeria booriae]
MDNSAFLQIGIPEETRREIASLFLDLAHDSTQIAIDELKARDWLTKKELCNYLNVSQPTIDNFVRLGCPVSRIERVIRFNTKEVNQWLLKQK